MGVGTKGHWGLCRRQAQGRGTELQPEAQRTTGPSETV